MPLNLKYFVLKPRSKNPTDPYAYAARAAMLEYAKTIRNEDPEMAGELCQWVEIEILRVQRLNREARKKGEN